MFRNSGIIGYYEPININEEELPTMLITTN